MTAPGSVIAFRRHLRADVVPGDAVYLFSEREVTALQGAAVEALAPLLDGTRDLAGLLRDIPSHITHEQAKETVGSLASAGLIGIRGNADADDCHALSYWDAAGLDAAAAHDLGTRPVSLITVGEVDPAAALSSLRACGLDTVSNKDIDTGLTVVLCDDYLSHGLEAVNQAFHESGRPWLLAKPAGERIWIGPFFTAGGACWRCLADRLWGNRQAEAHVQRSLGRPGHAARPKTCLPALAHAALAVVALEANKWLAGYRYAGQERVWTFDTTDLGGVHHELRQRPQCTVCGDPNLVQHQGWQGVALSAADGTAGPEEFLATYRHLISPVTGVVREIQRYGSGFFNSYRSGPSQALNASCLENLRAAQQIENGGKGITALQGEASALGEALERHCGTWRGEEAHIWASAASLGDAAIHPNECQLYDERQYLGRTEWNAANSAFQYVYERFDPSAKMSWTPVWSLTAAKHRLLPTSMLYYGTPAGSGPTCAGADSNGNAAGASLTDAFLRGLLELAERDAVALWWYNRTRHPAIDLDAFANPWIKELREVYGALHREVWVLDVTADLGIPTFAAVSRRTDQPGEEIMLGFGAHPDARVALTRALTEMNQLMPMVTAGCISDPDASRWLQTATRQNQHYLVPDESARSRVPDDFCAPEGDLHAQAESLQARVESLGLEVLILDQSRPDVGLPVVKVIVPGLRHFWARFAPGRLFDVPVRLGRLAKPTEYEQLNPVPVFL